MAEEGRRRAGTDILQQRMSSGASLASSLLQAAGGARLEPGETLDLDLFGTLDRLQGGADVTPYAKGLLMGAGGGEIPPGVVQPPTTGPGVSGMRGGLPPQPLAAGL